VPCCSGACGSKLRWALFTVSLVVICAISEYYFRKREIETSRLEAMRAVDDTRNECTSQIAGLHKEISYLKEEISSLKSSLENNRHVCDQHTCNPDNNTNASNASVAAANVIRVDNRRKKWIVWFNLKQKIESGESFKKELQEFTEMFSNDHDLMLLVKKLAEESAVLMQAPRSDNYYNVVDICKEYLQKIVRIQKVNYRKLLEISGYVLSSSEDMK